MQKGTNCNFEEMTAAVDALGTMKNGNIYMVNTQLRRS